MFAECTIQYDNKSVGGWEEGGRGGGVTSVFFRKINSSFFLYSLYIFVWIQNYKNCHFSI